VKLACWEMKQPKRDDIIIKISWKTETCLLRILKQPKRDERRENTDE